MHDTFIRDPWPRPSLWVVAARMSDRRGGLYIFERFAGEKGEESSLSSIILAHMTYYTLSVFNFVCSRPVKAPPRTSSVIKYSS
jgi:hypothetical protein